MTIDRRGFLGALAAIGSTSIACRRASGVPGTVRVGFLANLTHAPMIVALASGRLAQALPGVKIETRTFRAGPRVCEALLGNAIDLALTGPGPVVSMHARHPGSLVLLSGAASGGASLVALPHVRDARDLAGKRVATPQIGSTQDVSLRTWLARNGLASKEHGGDVAVDALAPANILSEMARGAIAGAWLPEPWATRVVAELRAKRLLDERDTWPERRFPSALFVARRAFHAERSTEALGVARVLREEIARGLPRDLVFAEVARLTGKGLPRHVLDEAWRFVDFTVDPLPRALAKMAEDSHALGYVPSADLGGLVA